MSGNSGTGSFNRLAEFKAEVINRFVRERDIRTVIEFGCGDGNQLALGEYPTYIGVDVAPEAIALCRARFRGDETKRFYLTSSLRAKSKCDLALSLDVIYHLIEHDTFEKYMTTLFDASSQYVIIYSSNKDAPGSASHVRHRAFGVWIAEHRRDWKLIEMVKNKYPFDILDPDNTSFADFYIYERR